MVWQINGTPATLTSSSDDITISDLTAEKNNVILSHMSATGGNIAITLRLGSGSVDSATNYADRFSTNGAADSTQTSITSNNGFHGTGNDSLALCFISNIAAEEKLMIGWNVVNFSTGAGTAPSRRENVAKWANTTNQFDNVNFNNTDTGSYAIGSNLSALGDVVTTPTVGGWVELGRTTLGSGNSTINVASLADKRFLMFLSYGLNTAANNVRSRYNSDTGTNYANRWNTNGGSDSSEVSKTWNHYDPSISTRVNSFTVGNMSNLAANEKLNLFHTAGQNTAGAGNAPDRAETANKWVNTSDPFDEIDVINEGGTFSTGSEVVVLGWDPTDTHTTNFWEELASVEITSAADTIESGTFTAKKYLWIQFSYSVDSTNGNERFRFNADTSTNYANRYSVNGGTDSTQTSDAFIYARVQGNQNNTVLVNSFVINNSANEKLIITKNVYNNTDGAGNATIREEIVGKWANTAAQITSFDIIRSAGNYNGGSILKVWGSD